MDRVSLLLMIAVFFLLACNNQAENPVITASPEEKEMDSLSALVSQARSFQERGEYDKAVAIADAMLVKYPGQLDALGLKAEILKDQGKNDEALALLERAYTLQPRDKETAYNLAYEYAERKSPRTLSLTDTLVTYDKTATVAKAWYIKATYYKNIGNERNALRYYDSSSLADYNFLDTYLDKGQLLYKQKQYEKALRAFATGQKLSPGTADFYFWVAKSQEALGEKADAKMNYERAFALDKTLTEAKIAAEKL